MRKARWEQWIIVGLAALGTATLTQYGVAQPRDRVERREDRRERREDRREERREERQAAREDIKDEWKAKHAAWVAGREERRRAWREDLRKTWGDLLDRPAVREELRIHARRMARLERIRFLAEATDKTDIVTRTDAAITKERARHDARMTTLKTEGAK